MYVSFPITAKSTLHVICKINNKPFTVSDIEALTETAKMQKLTTLSIEGDDESVQNGDDEFLQQQGFSHSGNALAGRKVWTKNI